MTAVAGGHIESPSTVQERTPVSALGWTDSGGAVLQTYWMNPSRQIVTREYQNSGWGTQLNVVAGPIVFAQICSAQYDSGAHVMVYYQDEDSAVIREVRNDGNGWFDGATITTGN